MKAEEKGETKVAAKARIEAAFREHWPEAQANWSAATMQPKLGADFKQLRDAGRAVFERVEYVNVRIGPGKAGHYPLTGCCGASITEAADKVIADIPRLLEKKRLADEAGARLRERRTRDAEAARHAEAVLRNRCGCEDCTAIGNRLVLTAENAANEIGAPLRSEAKS